MSDEERPSKRPKAECDIKNIVMVIVQHEEGAFSQIYNYVLPLALPKDLNKDLRFLNCIVPFEEQSTLLKREELKEPSQYGPNIKDHDCQLAFSFFRDYRVESNFDEEGNLCFFQLMDALCGKPVVDIVGKVYPVIVSACEWHFVPTTNSFFTVVTQSTEAV